VDSAIFTSTTRSNCRPAVRAQIRPRRRATAARPLTFVRPTRLGPACLRDCCAAFRSELATQAFPVAVTELDPGGALSLPGGAVLRVAKTPPHPTRAWPLRVDAGGRAVGYTGDTAPAPELAAFFEGVDLLVAECSFSRRRPRHPPPARRRTPPTSPPPPRPTTWSPSTPYFDPEAALSRPLARIFPGPITTGTDGATFEIL